MIVGFTGTKLGMTQRQCKALRNFLVANGATELHHGDCVGADAQAHKIAKSLGLRIVMHPPTNPRLRAFCKGADRTMPKQEYLDRNRNIVATTELLFAGPKERFEILRSGTWATVRAARKANKPVLILKP